MTKYFCDRCGKESDKLEEIHIPDKKTIAGSFMTKPIQVCRNCEQEHNVILDKCVDIRFILYEGFMKGCGKQ